MYCFCVLLKESAVMSVSVDSDAVEHLHIGVCSNGVCAYGPRDPESLPTLGPRESDIDLSVVEGISDLEFDSREGHALRLVYEISCMCV